MATMNRKLDMERTLDERLNDLLYWYVQGQWSLDEYLTERKSRLYEHPAWKRVPMYMRYALRRLERYRCELIGREHMYFAYLIDGKPTTYEQWREDNPDAVASSVFDHCPSGTFWKRTHKPHHVSAPIKAK